MLSETEADYLGRIAQGKSIHDIALEDGIPVAQIADGINSAIVKLQAENLLQAIVKAMRLNLLGKSHPTPPE